MLIKILYLFILTSCSGHTVEDDTNPSLEDSENNGVSSQSNIAPIISQEIDGDKEIKTVEYPDKKTVTESLSNEYFNTYYKIKETEYVKRNDEWAIKEKKSFSSGQTLIKSERYFIYVEKGNPIKWIYETTESGEFKST